MIAWLFFPFFFTGALTQGSPITLPCAEVPEPSGIVYHFKRGTLFVAGDNGNLCEFQTSGKKVHCRELDFEFEGITYNPQTGFLYGIDESDAILTEINPNTLKSNRQWGIKRKYKKNKVLKKNRNGIEGITFVAKQSGGGIFWGVIQQKNKGDNPSALIQFKVPFSRSKQPKKLRISLYKKMEITDLSGLQYHPPTGNLFALSDENDQFLEIDRKGNIVRSLVLPGKNQEGVTVDDKGTLYIAQDSGGVLVLPDFLTTAKELK